MPSSGSITSPLPESRNVDFVSATMSNASRCRSERSVRHSFASSTAARGRLPWYSCSLPSKREKSDSASAVLPANPARILSLYSRRVFFALCLITLSPMVTWPSAVSTTLLSLRTHNTVVPCICSLLCVIGIRRLYPAAAGMGHRDAEVLDLSQRRHRGTETRAQRRKEKAGEISACGRQASAGLRQRRQP